ALLIRRLFIAVAPDHSMKRAMSVRFFCIYGLLVALAPFFGHSWREDKAHYPRLKEALNASQGDYARFTIIGQDPISPEYDRLLKAPDGENWLGTDKDGRDVLARMLHGARISLSVGFVSESIAVLLG